MGAVGLVWGEELPVLRYLKDPVEKMSDLYGRYPNGGEYGWFALVFSERTFAWWDRYAMEWKLLGGEGGEGGGVTDLGMVTDPAAFDSVTGAGLYVYELRSSGLRDRDVGVMEVLEKQEGLDGPVDVRQVRREADGEYERRGRYATGSESATVWGEWEPVRYTAGDGLELDGREFGIAAGGVTRDKMDAGVLEELAMKATKEELMELATKSDLTGLAAKSELTNYVLKSELPTPVVLAGQGEAPLVPGVLGVRVNENGSVMLFQGGRASSLVSHYIRRGAVGETVTTVATKANTWGADGLEIIPAADATYGYTWEAVVTTWVGGMTICVHRITSVAQWMGRTYMRVIVEKIG